jgi:hypothetical protein
MIRERTEIISYSKDDLERILRHLSQQKIVGDFFIGKFGEQEIRWLANGGVEIITSYTEGSFEDLPPPKQLEASAEHKSKKGKR